MRALRLTAPLESEIVEIPAPVPGRDEVLLRAIRTAVSTGEYWLRWGPSPACSGAGALIVG